MTQSILSATTEVFNQSPPFEDVDLFTLDRPLAEAVAVNGGEAAKAELADFGRHWGSAAMAQRGRVANENTPKLKTYDARGFRRDEVEFHPAYHELMAHSAHAGLHNLTWNDKGEAAGGASEVIRGAKFFIASQVETGHLCPITMTRAAVGVRSEVGPKWTAGAGSKFVGLKLGPKWAKGIHTLDSCVRTFQVRTGP